jgi:hypothetical protein
MNSLRSFHRMAGIVGDGKSFESVEMNVIQGDRLDLEEQVSWVVVEEALNQTDLDCT